MFLLLRIGKIVCCRKALNRNYFATGKSFTRDRERLNFLFSSLVFLRKFKLAFLLLSFNPPKFSSIRSLFEFLFSSAKKRIPVMSRGQNNGF